MQHGALSSLVGSQTRTFRHSTLPLLAGGATGGDMLHAAMQYGLGLPWGDAYETGMVSLLPLVLCMHSCSAQDGSYHLACHVLLLQAESCQAMPWQSSAGHTCGSRVSLVSLHRGQAACHPCIEAKHWL